MFRLPVCRVFLRLSCAVLALLGHAVHAQGPERADLAIVSAASYEARAVAPNSIATIFGNALSVTAVTADTQPLPTKLGTVTVTIKDARNVEHAAGLFFVSPTQINFLVPPQAASGAALITVNDGLRRIEGATTIAPVAPALFAANANGQGPALGVLLRINANGSQQTEPLAEFSSACQCFVARPLSFESTSGEQRFLILFGTGWRNRADVRDLTVRLGGVIVPVSFAGAQGSFAGLDQLNLAFQPVLGDSLSGAGRLEIAMSASGYGSSNVVEIERTSGEPLLGGMQITGFEPARALAGDRLTIRGSGFPSGIAVCSRPFCPPFTVRIGKLEAPILSSTETTIMVKVPYGTVSDKVSVQFAPNGGVSANPLPVRTSVSGLVEDTRRRPLAGVRVTVAGTTNSVRTNAEGLFVLPDVAADPAARLTIDGTALGLTAEFPRLQLTVPIRANRDNFIAHPIVLQQATGTAIKLGTFLNGSAAEASGATPGFALQPSALWPLTAEFGALQQQPAGNFAFTLLSNGFVVPTCDDPAQDVSCTQTIEQLTLTQIENSRVPRPLPRGYFSSAIAQLTLLNAGIVPGGTLTFPNADRWPAAQPLKLFHLTQALRGQDDKPGEWVEIAGGSCVGSAPCPGARVSADGQRVETVEGIIRETGLYFAALERPTTTLTGRLVQLVESGSIGLGQPLQYHRSLARALVAARGQITVTDDNGGFVLRHVPVLGRGEQTAVEFSFIRYDQSGNERVERLVRPNVALIPNSVTDLEITEAKPLNENRPPLIFAGARFTVAEGRTSDYELLVTDADSGADPRETLRVNLSGPSFAALITRGAGRYTLRLTPGFADAGEHRVVFSAVDRAGATATQQLALTVTEVNQPPRALAQTLTIEEDIPKPIMLTGNDPDRDALRFSLITPPRNGRLSGEAPDLLYTPNANFFGTDSFTFRVSDGVLESEPATISLLVNSVNDAPTLTLPGEQRVEAGKPLSFTLTADDADTGDRLRIAAPNLPTGATLTPITAAGARAAARFDWTPTNTQTGLYIVAFQAVDDGTPANTTTRTIAFTVVAAGDTSAGVWAATGGPAGGGDLTAVLATDDTVLAGTTSFGVYRSTNNGQTWTRNADAPFVPNYVRAFAASNASFFAASYLDGVLRSTDRGLTWQPANQGLPALTSSLTTPYLLAARGTTVFAVLGGNSGLGGQSAVEVYRSLDDGATWTRVENGLPRIGTIVDLAFTNDGVFAAFQNRLYRSTDNGASWQDITLAMTEDLIFADLLGKDDVLFAATQQGLLRLTKQGAAWTPLAQAPPGLSELALSGGNLFAVAPNGTQQSVYRSTDNGATWTRRDTGLPPTGDFAPSLAYRLATSATHLFVNAFGKLYVSANQGDRWEPATPLTNLTVRTLATLRAGTAEAQLFAGTESGVATTTVPWRDWRAANNGLLPSQTGGVGAAYIGQLLTLENLLFAQVIGGFFRTEDGGRTWQESSTGLPSRTSGFIQTAGAHRTALFASVTGFSGNSFNYTVYRSLDRGANWQEARQGLPNANVLCFTATGIEGDLIVAGTAGSGVYLSADNGATWRALNQGLPQNIQVFALASLPGGSRLLAGTSNGLFAFNNVSQSWTRVATGLPPDTTVNALHVAGELVFAVTAPNVTACPNGGFLLPDLDGRLRCFGSLFDGQKPRAASPAAPEQLLGLSSGLGEIFVSTDQGTTWAALHAGLPRGAATTLGSSGRTIFAGTAGGGVFVRQF